MEVCVLQVSLPSFFSYLITFNLFLLFLLFCEDPPDKLAEGLDDSVPKSSDECKIQNHYIL